MKLENDEEKAVWMSAIQSASEACDEDGVPLDTPEQVAAACEYADQIVEEYRKRL